MKAVNIDPYGARILSYAEDWANYMERDMAAGKPLEECAKASSHEADTDGITGFMYGAAVDVLAHAWEYGDALRRWHNLAVQIGNEGVKANESGGTLNPALLRIG